MITATEACFIREHAYVPEHLPGYVHAISQAEPYLLGAYLCFQIADSLMFNGYPLGPPTGSQSMLETLESATVRFKPRRVALIAPVIPRDRGRDQIAERDQYYRLDLAQPKIDGKLRNMLRRASRELRVECPRELGEDHTRLISEFASSHPLSQEMRYIFERIPGYVSSVPTAQVFSVRDRTGRLAAFDVAEFGAGSYAFYQFNFRSRAGCVPGASDLLLQAVITAAQERGKRFLNLGLGINAGVRRFKEKWGGTPFLDYEFCRYKTTPPTLLDAVRQRL
jgi:hypothetical protein